MCSDPSGNETLRGETEGENPSSKPGLRKNQQVRGSWFHLESHSNSYSKHNAVSTVEDSYRAGMEFISNRERQSSEIAEMKLLSTIVLYLLIVLNTTSSTAVLIQLSKLGRFPRHPGARAKFFHIHYFAGQ